MAVLHQQYPNWRELQIHESSPGSPNSRKIGRECPGYLPTQFFPDIPKGEVYAGFRCEDLERQTFADASFDLVITQDVFEHILDPAVAWAEIARTLVPGGAHLFTIPWYSWKATEVRACWGEDGQIVHLLPPDYHGNPIDESGSLVVTEWGRDLCDLIYRATGMTTTVFRIRDLWQGIDAEFIEVFLSRKPL